MTATASHTAQRRFAGPRMVVVATIALGLTAPGQTASISVFLDPMIAEIGVSRTAVSTAYMVGTLTGALALPWIGRAVDRYGTRTTMAVVATAFSLALVGLSFAQNIIGLGAGFIGIRMLGQGALGLCAATLVSRWYDKRRGTVLGLQGAIGGGIISISPVILERVIAATDWRTAMHLEAAAVALIVVPLAVLLVRNRPGDIGQFVDGDPANEHASTAEWGMTRGEAMRHPYFWVLVASVGTAGFFGTAIGFHQIALLGEQGLSATEAAANFLPQTIAGTLATLLLGYLVDRGRPRLLLAASMLGFALAVAWGTAVEPGWSALGFGLAIGAAGNALRSIESAMTPRLFGTAHIGSIRGVVASVTIAAVAFAPLLYSLFHDWTGSFRLVLWLSTLVPLAVMIAALVTPLPHPASRPEADTRV
ncbi:MFS transporter [Glycomyces sp. TRM65418]|uniref:MFS transporter n=1 Tax=Glycomyces sp. TRM65418 TaxID=2867006 RepID=UPI001CE53BBD|nr:MFS transporter [Glycomyces sp. TRM65418]MCC3761945.1 MFS transporter [Glycomyces sp. TRM65418]QZD56024.1 MFS transporter [Glycomyces sp. TRM65418]